LYKTQIKHFQFSLLISYEKTLFTLCLGIFGFQNFAQVPYFPKQYICYKTPQNLKIDGKLDEDAWQKAS
jgi:hypothetical protein